MPFAFNRTCCLFLASELVIVNAFGDMCRAKALLKVKALLAGSIVCAVYIVIQNEMIFEEASHRKEGPQSHMQIAAGPHTRKSSKQFLGRDPLIFLYTRKIHSSLMYNEPCQLTRDPLLFTKSDAVVFHGKDLPLPERIAQLRSMPRVIDQLWVYFMLESPRHTRKVSSNEMLFNITITPQRNSDIFHPYAYYNKRTDSEEGKVDMKRKTGFIAWCVSNCAARLRNDYVHLLQRYTKVQVFGKCSRDFGAYGICERNTEECEQYLAQYKFYLAFENSLCTDYVTEKYWGALSRGNVPIVLAANVDTMIPGSYIDASKFETVRKLAMYLDYLAKNDAAYLEYFKWREVYEIDYDPQDAQRSDMWLPQLCDYLLDMDPSERKVVNISRFYGVENNCPKEREEKIIRIIEKGV